MIMTRTKDMNIAFFVISHFRFVLLTEIITFTRFYTCLSKILTSGQKVEVMNKQSDIVPQSPGSIQTYHHLFLRHMLHYQECNYFLCPYLESVEGNNRKSNCISLKYYETFSGQIVVFMVI